MGSVSTMLIAAVQPINQMVPDHWHTKADKSVLMAEDLEEIRSRYQIPKEVELRIPTAKKRASDARPMEFTLYERGAAWGPEVTPSTVSCGCAKPSRGSPRAIDAERVEDNIRLRDRVATGDWGGSNDCG